MKRLLLTLALVSVFAILLSFSVSAAYDNQVDNGEGSITAVGDCVIEGIGTFPATRGLTYRIYDGENGYAVVKDTHRVQVEELYVPSTVTFNGVVYTVKQTVGGQNANNTVLSKVYIPDSVEVIGDSSFSDTYALKEVYIGKGVTTFAYCAFEEAAWNKSDDSNLLEKFICKSHVISKIDGWAFRTVSTTKDIEVELNISNPSIEIGNGAFANDATGRVRGYILKSIDFTIYNDDNISSSAISNNRFIGAIYMYPSQFGKYFSPSAGNIVSDTGVPVAERVSNFVIVGANDAATANADAKYQMTRRFLSQSDGNFQWWTAQCDVNFIIKGYVKGFDEVDGSSNFSHYRIAPRFIFESEGAYNYYINSIASGTNAAETFANYAKTNHGMFAICDENGVPVAYNFKYENGVTSLVSYTNPADENAQRVNPTYAVTLEGYCNPSVLCLCCDKVITEGVKHTIVKEISYADGYLSAGAKIEACTNVGCEHKVELALEPMFIVLGYSIFEDGDGSFVQSFVINHEAYDAYKLQSPDFKFGIVASANGSPLDANGSFVSGVKGVKRDMTITADMVDAESGKRISAFQIKIKGLKNKPELAFIGCAYVIDGNNVYYLNNGETVSNVEPKSYAELTA